MGLFFGTTHLVVLMAALKRWVMNSMRLLRLVGLTNATSPRTRDLDAGLCSVIAPYFSVAEAMPCPRSISTFYSGQPRSFLRYCISSKMNTFLATLRYTPSRSEEDLWKKHEMRPRSKNVWGTLQRFAQFCNHYVWRLGNAPSMGMNHGTYCGMKNRSTSIKFTKARTQMELSNTTSSNRGTSPDARHQSAMI